MKDDLTPAEYNSRHFTTGWWVHPEDTKSRQIHLRTDSWDRPACGTSVRKDSVYEQVRDGISLPDLSCKKCIGIAETLLKG
jgi:hypothetical protein